MMYSEFVELSGQAGSVQRGAVVVTQHGFDVGIVAEADDYGEPVKVYAYDDGIRIDEHPEQTWLDTGVRMTLGDWTKLCKRFKDASEFVQYWEMKLVRKGGKQNDMHKDMEGLRS